MNELLEEIIETAKTIGECKILIEYADSHESFWKDQLIKNENKLKELKEKFDSLLNEV